MSRFFLPHIAQMQGYVPGEQPKDGVYLKLNTNENPYPPSPRVAEAIRDSLDDRLRLYPDPVGSEFRKAVADLLQVEPEMVLAGNGSDDALTILTRAFVGTGQVLVYPTPSYVLYRTLAEIQGARAVEVPFDDNWRLDPATFAEPEPSLAFVPNPNSPSGTVLSNDDLAALAERLPCPLVVDEAYVDFADSDAIDLVRRFENVVVTRTLSKGYGLAGLRIGYLVAQPKVVEGLLKVKDSYNCDRLSLVGGTVALRDQAYLIETAGKIRATRQRLLDAVRSLGYHAPDSHANFVWCEGGPPAVEVYEALKSRKILVRLMRYPGRPDGLRISVGNDEETDRLIEALREILGSSAEVQAT